MKRIMKRMRQLRSTTTWKAAAAWAAPLTLPSLKTPHPLRIVVKQDGAVQLAGQFGQGRAGVESYNASPCTHRRQTGWCGAGG